MQLLLLLLLLSSGGAQPLIEALGGADLLNNVGQLADLAGIAEPVTLEKPTPDNDEKCPLDEILSFADPEIISALKEFLDG